MYATRSAGLLVIPLLGLCLLSAALFAEGLHKVDKQKVSAFRAYYHAAVAMRQGESPYDLHFGSYPYVYPPLYAFLCQPLAGLSAATAAQVMLTINWALLLASLLAGTWAVLSHLGHSPTAANALWVAFITSLIVICPIFKELLSFQADFVILASFVFAFVWLDKHPILAGLSLALGIAIKYLPIIALPYLLLRRRWTAVVATVVGSVLLTLLPAVSLGWSRNLHFLVMSNGGLARILGQTSPQTTAHTHNLADSLNISSSSALARLAATMGWPEKIALVLTAAVAVLWLALLLLQYRSLKCPMPAWPPASGQQQQPFRGMLALEWAGILVAAIAFSPNANLLLALFPTMVLVTLLPWPTEQVSKWMMPVAALLILVALFVPIAFMGPRFTANWNSLGAPSWLLLAAYVMVSGASLRIMCDRFCPRC